VARLKGIEASGMASPNHTLGSPWPSARPRESGVSRILGILLCCRKRGKKRKREEKRKEKRKEKIKERKRKEKKRKRKRKEKKKKETSRK
jgi:hypothetical protein